MAVEIRLEICDLSPEVLFNWESFDWRKRVNSVIKKKKKNWTMTAMNQKWHEESKDTRVIPERKDIYKEQSELLIDGDWLCVCWCVYFVWLAKKRTSLNLLIEENGQH